MRFSLNFVKEFLEIEISPEELARLLTMAGMEVEGFQKVGGDWVFDIEVTSNRYDWLSIVGIAKEIAAILGKNFKIKYPLVTKSPPFSGRDIIIEDVKDCPYYIGRVVKGVKVGISPPWLKERLLNCGIVSVNDIVDITNYCMLKWGNPLHAFDDDKLKGNIYIRRAKKGESFIGIDGRERVLDKTNLVIADSEKVVALAGIMGAKNTEIDSTTKNIFLEGAIFSPLTVRRSRRAIGLDTESSYRFERNVSPDYLEYASYQAAQLMGKLAQGIPVGFKKAGRKPSLARKKIIISFSHLNAYLGVSLAKERIKKILKNLDFDIKKITLYTLTLLSPAQRFDIKREVDVYEEIARIYGYEKIEPKIPFLASQFLRDLSTSKQDFYRFKEELASFITLLGFREIITYSLEGEEKLGKSEGKEVIKILNPLRKQEDLLRMSLLPAMAKSIRYNLNRNQGPLYFFEIAHTYWKDKKGFREVPQLVLGLSGELKSFFYLKKAVEEILGYLNIDKFKFKEESEENFTNALKVTVNNQNIGFLGKLDEIAKKSLDIKEDIFFAQLELPLLIKNRANKKYRPFSPYPVIWRDISILLEKDVKFKEVEEIIRKEGRYLIDLRIIDTYEGKDIPPQTKAFTLRIFYQSRKKTLTSQEVDSFHYRIREALSQKEGLKLR